MTISNRDKQLLVVFAGILLVVLTYFFLFTKLQEKTETLKADNVVLQEEVTKLESLELQKQDYLAKTQEYTLENSRIQASFDNGYLLEDDIMYLSELENDQENEVVVQYLNLATPVDIPAVITTTQGEMGLIAQPSPTALFRVVSDFGFEVSYQGFKNMVRYLYATGGRKNIEQVSLMFNSQTGQLSGTMALNRYFMTGTDRAYSPAPIPSMSMGVTNIFRTTDGYTKEAKVATEADSDTEDTATEDTQEETDSNVTIEGDGTEEEETN